MKEKNRIEGGKGTRQSRPLRLSRNHLVPKRGNKTKKTERQKNGRETRGEKGRGRRAEKNGERTLIARGEEDTKKIIKKLMI